MNRAENKASRLLQIENLLLGHPEGLTQAEIARRLDVDRSTIHRDLLDVPGHIYVEDDGRLKIDRTADLINVRLNLHEALSVHIAARLLATRMDRQNPHAASALRKLGVAMERWAARISKHVLQSADVMDEAAQRHDPVYLQVLEKLTQAWADQRKAQIWHHSEVADKVMEYTFSPYFIEPYAVGQTTHVIGLADPPGKIRTFKIERIRRVEISRDPYELPAGFDPRALLADAWGIWYSDNEPVEVALKFHPRVARRVQETRWHRSAEEKELPDGSLLWQARVAEPQEMLPWIRGWGADCEVLEPEGLRKALEREARRMARLYGVAEMTQNKKHERVLRLWGKTKSKTAYEFHPALFHMLDVACVARVLLESNVSPRWHNVLAKALNTNGEALINWLPWAIALHDIGKISVPFQEQNETQRNRLIKEGFNLGEKRWRNDPPHGITSQVFLKDENIVSLPEQLREALIDMCGGHHGYFDNKDDQKKARYALKNEPESEWVTLRKETAQTLYEILVNEPVTWPEPSNISTASMALTGFTILCDWLGSDAKVFAIESDMSLNEYFEVSMSRAREVVQKAGLLLPHQSDAPELFGNLFSNISIPRPLQMAIDAIPDDVLSEPCLAVIEAPTGEGKTEAALALAHRIAIKTGTDEFYYALPTTATSNQMFQRLQRYLQDNLNISTQIKLIHGQAFLVEDDLQIEPMQNGSEEESDSLDWFGPKKRSLLAPFGVGTIDQAELAALNVKHVPLRMIGLAGKVVIVDEVHAYDTYMTTIIEQLLKWLSAIGTSVILLSATLPKERRARLAEAYGTQLDDKMRQGDSYPSLWVTSKSHSYCSFPRAQQEDRRIDLDTSLRFGDDQAMEKASWLISQVAHGGCACWMTNTVRRAQEIYEAIKQLAPGNIEHFLLHAQFTLDERQQREEEITRKFGPKTNERKPSIVIGTQVLEQSLDLDFDVMASDLAPIDLLLQRAGRLHRHPGRERPSAHTAPRFFVNVEKSTDGELELGVNARVYDGYILRQTWLALTENERDSLTLPVDYRPLIELVYGGKQPAPDNPLSVAWKKLQSKQNDALQQAQMRILPDPHPRDSFTGPASRLRFIESETEAGWIIAKTRLGEESLNVIPLEKDGDMATCVVNGETLTIRLTEKPTRDVQLKLLRHSLRVSNYQGVEAIKKNIGKIPTAFSGSALLKDYVPLFLANGSITLPGEKSKIVFKLDPDLGLVIRTEKGA